MPLAPNQSIHQSCGHRREQQGVRCSAFSMRRRSFDDGVKLARQPKDFLAVLTLSETQDSGAFFLCFYCEWFCFVLQPKALRLQLARKSNVPAPEPVVSVPTLQPILPSELVVPQRQATEQHALPAVSVQGASPSKTVEAPRPGPADQEGSSCSSLETSDSLTPQRPGRRPRRRRSTRVAAILDQEHRSPAEAPATGELQWPE